MPYEVVRDEDRCSVSEPWAVVKQGGGDLMGCHSSKEKANDQMAALYANEPEARSRASQGDLDNANLDTPDAGDLNAAAKRVAADRGWAMEDGSYTIRPKDNHGASDLDKAIHAVGRGGGSHNAIRRHIMKRASAIGLSERIPENWNDDGSLEGRSRLWTASFTRSYPLEDISIRSEGDGRTVDAYAAVFNSPSEVHDQDGHYIETIAPTSFNKTIAERAQRFGVFYNHGMTLYGTPSERASVPLGRPIEIRPDGRGLFTRTRYNRGQFADEILESIRNGDITGQSFTGRFVKSNPERVPRRGRGGQLPEVNRTEIALKEYGPTPFPVYESANIVGVRAMLDHLDSLTDEQREELMRLLSRSTPVEEPEGTATPEEGAGTDESHERSNRLQIKSILNKMRMNETGVRNA